MHGYPPQSGLPVVLSLGARRRRSRSFDVFQEPAWPLPRERSPAQAVRYYFSLEIAGQIIGPLTRPMIASCRWSGQSSGLISSPDRQPHVDSSRPECANSRRLPKGWRSGQIDPKRMTGRSRNQDIWNGDFDQEILGFETGPRQRKRPSRFTTQQNSMV